MRPSHGIAMARLERQPDPEPITFRLEPERSDQVNESVGDRQLAEAFRDERDGHVASPSLEAAIFSSAERTTGSKGLLRCVFSSSDTMIAYYGRLLASTRQGAASAPLALPLQVQYFEGGRWRVNLQDLCTRLSLAGDGILFTDPEQHYDAATGDLSLKDGTRIRLGLGQVAPGGSQASVEGGEIRFHFAAPNQSVRIPYRIQLDKLPLQPLAPLWLADPATADHLLGEAIFGRDRGNDRIIYRREVMP